MVELQSAQFKDYASVAALHATSWQMAYRGIMSDRFLNEEVEREMLEKWHNRLSSPGANQVVTLAVQNNITLGFSCIYLDDSSTYGTLLDNLHVAASFQQSGVGKLLMQNCATVIRERSRNHKMYLWVFDVNQKARQFYERLGGDHLETTIKKNEDGSEANVCRYVWEDAAALLI